MSAGFSGTRRKRLTLRAGFWPRSVSRSRLRRRCASCFSCRQSIVNDRFVPCSADNAQGRAGGA